MHLINVSRLLGEPPSGTSNTSRSDTDLIERFKSNPPPYAILSHRWFDPDPEISFQDMKNNSFEALLRHPALGKSAEKVQGSCLKAKEKGINYLWDDTCCIDKSANAEESLNESLASMFKWYNEAKICLVYLADVPDNGFAKSEWFERGWTLQELIAPRNVEFFDHSWQYLGTREQLSDQIQAATNIAPEYLNNFTANRHKASVAMKMSWASKRKLERIEDTAYSLFGIFDVAIDVRYGEGRKAFRRLQEAIIHESNDESIFAWTSDQYEYCGMLAPWIDCFEKSHDIHLRPEKYRTRGPYSMTNQGLQFPVPYRIAGSGKQIHSDLYLNIKDIRNHYAEKIPLPLYCWRMEGNHWEAINIYLSKKSGYWRRSACNELLGTKKIKAAEKSVFFKARYYMVDILIRQLEERKNGNGTAE